MIRGINRQIIDVQDTGSTYYERAYLVVKPEFAAQNGSFWKKKPGKFSKIWTPLPA